MTRKTDTTRRAFLGSSVLATAGLPFAGKAVAAPAKAADDFRFEVTKTDDEWRAQLGDHTFEIMRRGGTEWPGESELWDDYRAGEFHCRACDLHLYSSDWRVELDKGWVFFGHGVPNAVLMDIDTAADYSASRDNKRTLIEAHCRRCGSHLGHILNVDRKLVHCINGASLQFVPATT